MKHLTLLPLTLLITLLDTVLLLAQTPDFTTIVNGYIDTYKYIAIREMKQYGIPASITLAQGILESNAGRSDLATKANNHFGIKCHKEWTGPTFHQDDDRPNECFRKYKDPLDSYRDHSLFLTTRERYKGLFSLSPTDYKGWAEGLKAAGYATNPKYPELLIGMIERFSLHLFDGGEVPVQPVPGVTGMMLNPAFSGLRYAYFAPGPDGRKTYTNNHTWFVIAAPGEDLRDISIAFELPVGKLLKFNDLETGDAVREGEPVYLAKKQGKAEVKTHKVLKGQTLWEVSQLYAIRLAKLASRNGLDPGREPAAGTLLKLR